MFKRLDENAAHMQMHSHMLNAAASNASVSNPEPKCFAGIIATVSILAGQHVILNGFFI